MAAITCMAVVRDSRQRQRGLDAERRGTAAAQAGPWIYLVPLVCWADT